MELLALARTAFISERTLLAWMHTSVSLITFGFSITKFFEYLEQQQQGLKQVKRYLLPLGTASLLLVFGLVALLSVVLNLTL